MSQLTFSRAGLLFWGGPSVAIALSLGPLLCQGQTNTTTIELPLVTVEASPLHLSVSGDEVQSDRTTSPLDLLARAPNLTVLPADDGRTPKFSIRGLRENSFGVGEPVIGIYVDDVPYFDLISRAMAFYGLYRVFRGNF